jgi:hypothetical protein
MAYTRNDGSSDEPVETRMVEFAPHMTVSEDFAKANGMSALVPKLEPKPQTRKRKP